jgi:hypothetical protein
MGGARVEGTGANGLNFAFLGQRIALIGQKRLQIPSERRAETSIPFLIEMMGRQPLNAIRFVPEADSCTAAKSS